MPVFRIHMSTGAKLDIEAATAAAASKAAKDRSPDNHVVKVKLVREQQSGAAQ